MNAPASLRGFPPIVTTSSRILILGSMPGAASLQARAYYAHPRNAFWEIVGAITAVDASAPYATRVAGLERAGLALWDVVDRCVRAGSLDAAIDDASVVPNDVATLLDRHRCITRVALNGGKTAALFRRHVGPALAALGLAPDVRVLPSTSPAHASRTLADKRAVWLAALGADAPRA